VITLSVRSLLEEVGEWFFPGDPTGDLRNMKRKESYERVLQKV
jgi:hypothetical protein